jgi:putative transposase
MKKISYGGYRFPPEIIQQAIWLYLRFTLSLRDVEDLLAERGIVVSYESIRALDKSLRADDRSGLA